MSKTRGVQDRRDGDSAGFIVIGLTPGMMEGEISSEAEETAA